MKKIVKILSLILILGLVGCGPKEISHDIHDDVINETIIENTQVVDLEAIKNEYMNTNPVDSHAAQYYDLHTALVSPDFDGVFAENILATIADGYFYSTKTENDLIYNLTLIKDIANEMYDQKYINELNTYIDTKENVSLPQSNIEDVFISIDTEQNLVQILNYDSSFASRHTEHTEIDNIELNDEIYTMTINEWYGIQGEGWGKNEIYDPITGNFVTLTDTAFENLIKDYIALEPDYTFTVSFTENSEYTYSKYKLLDAACTKNIEDTDARKLQMDSIINSYTSNPENIAK